MKDLGAILIVNKSDLGLDAVQTQLTEYRQLKLTCLDSRHISSTLRTSSLRFASSPHSKKR